MNEVGATLAVQGLAVWLIAAAVVAVAGWVVGHGAGLVCSAVRFGDIPGLPRRPAGLCLGVSSVTIGLGGCLVVTQRLMALGLLVPPG